MKYSKEVKVGLFSVIGVAMLVAGYNFLKGFNPLQGYNTYYVVYNSVEGVVKSTQVTINGLKVGQVEDIHMLRKGDPSQLVVTLVVENSIQLPKGTTATIASSGILGSTDIVVHPAQGTEFYTNKDTLVAEYQESLQGAIKKIVDPIKEKSEKVLVTLDNMLNSLNQLFDSTGTKKLETTIDDVAGTMHNLRNVTGRFDKLTEEEYNTLKEMFDNLESITRSLRNNNEAIARSLKNVSRITDSVAAADLTSTINHTRDVMREFSSTLEKINKGEGTLGKLANDTSLYTNLNKTSEELNSLMTDMQEYPGRYFNVSVFGGGSRAEKQDKQRNEDKKAKK